MFLELFYRRWNSHVIIHISLTSKLHYFQANFYVLLTYFYISILNTIEKSLKKVDYSNETFCFILDWKSWNIVHSWYHSLFYNISLSKYGYWKLSTAISLPVTLPVQNLWWVRWKDNRRLTSTFTQTHYIFVCLI